MTEEEYRQQVLDHAKLRGYLPPTLKTTDFTYKSADGSSETIVLKDWIFTADNGTTINILFNPGTNAKGWLTSAKGRLTGAQGATSKPRKRSHLPSREINESWLFAHAPSAPDLDPEISGKWMMFVAWDKIDDTWKNVAAAVRKGRLAPHAKVSTFASNPTGTYPHVLCVYVADYRDQEDVMSIRERLREMGFKRRIPFKLDEMSAKGDSGSLFSA